jgi:putative pyruvate formate lyase activating enzyme
MGKNGSSAPKALPDKACDYLAGYVRLFETGELLRRAEMLEQKLKRCDLCPRECGVDRTGGKTGFCGVDARLRIGAINLHPWEEPPISGTRGSGTVFFSGCTLRCVYCQNYPISQMGVGREMSAAELASQMLLLQKRGAHNINLVTSTHQMAGFVRALTVAAENGLRIPLLYNTSGYESLEMLSILDGIIDIYLPDIKYSDPGVAQKLSGTRDYVFHNRRALIEMWRQAGPIIADPFGIAKKGMIVRHLVLPEGLSGTGECLFFLARSLGRNVWVSLMNQYFPAHKAHSTPPLDRKVLEKEYEAAFRALTDLGFLDGFAQQC